MRDEMNTKSNLKTSLFILVILISSSNLYTDPIDTYPVLRPNKVEHAPILDGILNDAAWGTDPTIEQDFISYWTIHGTVLPQKTSVWAVYDPDNLYFAFYCYDTDPQQIKTSVCSRDRMWEDDWVGLGLDAIGNRQGLYELFVNPNGIQGDRIRLASTGSYDTSVDWVWHCGAQLGEDGYTVEIQIPLKSLRFQSGENVEMGILFFRKINRFGLEGSWPVVPTGQGFLNCTQKIVYDYLYRQKKIEILPSVTSGSIWDRQSPEIWSSAETSNELGLSVKYGITTSVTVDATINPDFSQVESDAFQIQVNQRYPLFYTEKRPFFMESGNLFDLAGTGGESNMRTAVHTRKIVDPQWGAKLTGEVGKTTFAFLGVGDEWAGRKYTDGVNPYLGRNANFMIGRVKYTLSGENYLGAIYSGKELGGSHNRIVGVDYLFRFRDHHSIYSNLLYSTSNRPTDEGKVDGSAFHLSWDYRTKPFEAYMMAEHFDKNFNMETAYYKRTGITHLYYYLCPLWYPNPDAFPWIRRIRTFTFGYYRHDWFTDMADYFTQIVIQPFFKWNGWLRVDANLWGESWGGVIYHKKFYRIWSWMQVTKWMNFFTLLRAGESIFYDPVDHFKGDYVNWQTNLNFQPTENFNQGFSYWLETLKNPVTEESQYEVHILQSKTTYQFNEYFFIRAQIQYDSYRKVVLTDLLASFTLIPGTVMHLGYGSLHESLEWQNNQWLDSTPHGKFYQRSRSLFFKASYLFRL